MASELNYLKFNQTYVFDAKALLPHRIKENGSSSLAKYDDSIFSVVHVKSFTWYSKGGRSTEEMPECWFVKRLLKKDCTPPLDKEQAEVVWDVDRKVALYLNDDGTSERDDLKGFKFKTEKVVIKRETFYKITMRKA